MAYLLPIADPRALVFRPGTIGSPFARQHGACDLVIMGAREDVGVVLGSAFDDEFSAETVNLFALESFVAHGRVVTPSALFGQRWCLGGEGLLSANLEPNGRLNYPTSTSERRSFP